MKLPWIDLRQILSSFPFIMRDILKKVVHLAHNTLIYLLTNTQAFLDIKGIAIRWLSSHRLNLFVTNKLTVFSFFFLIWQPKIFSNWLLRWSLSILFSSILTYWIRPCFGYVGQRGLLNSWGLAHQLGWCFGLSFSPLK